MTLAFGFPALLSLDFVTNTIRRYERFAPVGVRLTHRCGANKGALRDCAFTVEEVNGLRLMMPMMFAIDMTPMPPDSPCAPPGGISAA